jgi:hypothetical protein
MVAGLRSYSAMAESDQVKQSRGNPGEDPAWFEANGMRRTRRLLQPETERSLTRGAQAAVTQGERGACQAADPGGPHGSDQEDVRMHTGESQEWKGIGPRQRESAQLEVSFFLLFFFYYFLFQFMDFKLDSKPVQTLTQF